MSSSNSFKHVMLVFASWRMAVVLLLGFSCGIPLALSGSTLQAWMKDLNVDLTVIGLFTIVSLPYSTKFVWAPLMDRYCPPFFPASWGSRRRWMAIAQVGIVAVLLVMSISNPAEQQGFVAGLAFLLAFLSASQDIAFDAYRVEGYSEAEYGVTSAIYVLGYRLAMLVSGGLTLILADRMPWKIVYVAMAAVMGLGLLTTLFSPEPKERSQPPRTLVEAFVLPFVEFFKRRGAIEVLIFLLIYKIDVWMTMALATPFFLDSGFTKTDIGVVMKTFGMIATIVGSLVGGAAMVKMGIKRSLWIFGITQALAGISYCLVAIYPGQYALMVMAVTVESFFSGTSIATFSAFMMSLCDKRYSATQYALITSFMALTRIVAGAPSGYFVQWMSWKWYYVASALMGIPGLLMLTLRYDKWTRPTNA